MRKQSSRDVRALASRLESMNREMKTMSKTRSSTDQRVLEDVDRAVTSQAWFSVPQVAEIFGVSEATAYRWIKRGVMHPEKSPSSGRWRIAASELRRIASEVAPDVSLMRRRLDSAQEAPEGI